MWCSRCKQDVPAQQQPPEAVLRCGVCAAVLRNSADGMRAVSDPAVSGPVNSGPPGKAAAEQGLPKAELFSPDNLLSDWRLDEDLEDVRRLIRRTAHRLEAAARLDDSFSLADCLETAAPPTAPLVIAPSPAAASQPQPAAPRRDRTASDRGAGDWTTLGGWVLVCLGAMGLVFASVLFTATMLGAKHSQPVWPLCMLSAFAGQFLVVIGFLLRNNGRRQPEDAQPQPTTVAAAAAQPLAEVPSAATTASLNSASALARPHSRPPWSANVEQALAAALDRPSTSKMTR